MTILNTEQIGLAHENMSTDDLYENLEQIADELGYTFDEIQEDSVEELEHEFGIYGALEIMAEESDEEVFLDMITDSSFRDDVWSGHVIGAKVHVVQKEEEDESEEDFYEVKFEMNMSVEAESEEEAKEIAPNVLHEHLRQLTLCADDFEVIE